MLRSVLALVALAVVGGLVVALWVLIAVQATP